MSWDDGCTFASFEGDDDGTLSEGESDELALLIKAVVAAVLEDDAIPPWSTISERYWRLVATHIMTNEPDVLDDIKALAEKVRARFRTCAEHVHRVRLVSCTKSTPSPEREQDMCCVCLRPTEYTWQRTVRLKSRDGDPTKCGHVLHASCASRLRPHEEDGYVHCPVCREVIGPSLRYWLDTESTVPRF